MDAEKTKAKGKGKGNGEKKDKRKDKVKNFTRNFARKHKMKEEKETASREETSAKPGSESRAEDMVGACPSAPEPAPSNPEKPSQADHPSSSAPREIKNVHRNPEEVLSQLVPPGCHIGLDFNAWRFVSNWKEVDATTLVPPSSQKTMSASFQKMRPWEEALRQVHKHNWMKWELISDQYPLPLGQEAQSPGQVSEEIIGQMKPFIDGLAKAKAYGKK